MNKSLGQALRIGIAPDGLALVRTARWGYGRPSLLGSLKTEGVSAPMIAQAVSSLLNGHVVAGRPVTVVLSNELVRLWHVVPPTGASRLTDLEGAAALRFKSLYGSDAAEWSIRANWNATSAFLAAALPSALLRELVVAARTHRLHLVEVVPQFVASLNQYRKLRRPGSWFGLVHDGVLTLSAFDGKALSAVRAIPIPPDTDRGWLENHVTREALRLGLALPNRIQICGAPTCWGAGEARMQLHLTLLDDDIAPSWPGVARLALSGKKQ